MFNILALCFLGFLAATNPAMADSSSTASAFDWNHLIQVLFAALAAYFGGKHGSSGQ
jgi:hypothetical protein